MDDDTQDSMNTQEIHAMGWARSLRGDQERMPFFFHWLLVAMLFIYGHLALAPQLDFLVDDWTNVYIANAQPSYAKAMELAVRHPTRPLSMVVHYTVFRGFGDHTSYYVILSAVMHAINMFLAMALIWLLTGHKRNALMAGLFVALLPTLSENVNWITMIVAAGSCAIPLFLASALAWVGFNRTNHLGLGVLSAVFYALGAFSYEIGVLLPLAYLFTLRKANFPKVFIVGLVYLILGGAYAGWYLTQGYGLAEHVTLAEHFTPDREQMLADLIVRAKEILHWWGGHELWGALATGMRGFNTLDIFTRMVVLAANGLIALALGSLLHRHFRKELLPSAAFRSWQPTLFGLAWFGATLAPCLMAYSASRLMYLPAIGLAVALLGLVNKTNPRFWCGAMMVFCFAGLTINQGINLTWRDSGIVNRRISDHLERTREQWQDKRYIVFNSRGIAEHLNGDLLRPTTHDLSSVAYLGAPNQVSLLHGVALHGMIQVNKTQAVAPRALLDVECGTRVEGEMLYFHDRKNPTAAHSVALDQVYFVDCYEALGIFGVR
ncbi:MAG: hypothetical protein ACI9TH_000327 [Kiritimatiellia bacterium]|jgi:hypothetical protein